MAEAAPPCCVGKLGAMKKSRIIVLFLALVAAASAFVLYNGAKAPPVGTLAGQPPLPSATDDVLVAAKNLPLGTLVNEGDLSWQPWPKDTIPAGMIRKSQDPKIIDDIKGSIARASLLQGEPIRREKLIKSEGGLMAATLPSGMRAVAINIDSQGATSAGGFILPGDRVDVIRTYHEASKPGSADNYVSETLLRNVKVRAVGQNVQQKDGQSVVVGSNATLELDPAQAEAVVLAQRTGQLSLTLRSMLDAKQGQDPVQASKSMTVVRFGTATEDANR